MTNNVSEGSNNAVNIAASHLAMAEYVFRLKHLQSNYAGTETVFLQQSSVKATRRGRRPTTVANDQRIFSHVARYEQPHPLHEACRSPVFVLCDFVSK